MRIKNVHYYYYYYYYIHLCSDDVRGWGVTLGEFRPGIPFFDTFLWCCVCGSICTNCYQSLEIVTISIASVTNHCLWWIQIATAKHKSLVLVSICYRFYLEPVSPLFSKDKPIKSCLLSCYLIKDIEIQKHILDCIFAGALYSMGSWFLLKDAYLKVIVNLKKNSKFWSNHSLHK